MVENEYCLVINGKHDDFVTVIDLVTFLAYLRGMKGELRKLVSIYLLQPKKPHKPEFRKGGENEMSISNQN